MLPTVQIRCLPKNNRGQTIFDVCPLLFKATARFELAIRVLQTHALPLGYVAILYFITISVSYYIIAIILLYVKPQILIYSYITQYNSIYYEPLSNNYPILLPVLICMYYCFLQVFSR